MRFNELHTLFNEHKLLKLDAIIDLFPDVPLEVLRQFYFEHGSKDSFQKQYGLLDLEKILWEKIRIKWKDIISLFVNYSDFCARMKCVEDRVNKFKHEGWNCIDSRENVVVQWRNNKTWAISPIVIDWSLINSCSKYWLVEGHTRVGLLKWLINHGILSPDLEHDIWYGRMT